MTKKAYDRNNWPKDKEIVGKLIAMGKYQVARRILLDISMVLSQNDRDIVNYINGIMFVVDIVWPKESD